jgi:nitroreductase
MTSIGFDVRSRMGLLRLLTADRPQPDRNGDPPDETQLDAILGAAVTVPDHGGIRPWRFTVIRGTGRDRFGEALVKSLEVEKGLGLPDAVKAKMRGKAFAAPCQVMIVASPRAPSNVPEWEQMASASCTGYAMVLAALALGLGAIWKSAAVLQADPVRALFRAEPHEQLLGWVNLGSRQADSSASPKSRRPLDLHSFTTTLDDIGEGPFGRA